MGVGLGGMMLSAHSYYPIHWCLAPCMLAHAAAAVFSPTNTAQEDIQTNM